MFTLSQLPTAAINQRVAAAAQLPTNSPPGLSLANGLDPSAHLPFGFVHDSSRSCIGQGEPAFTAATQAFRKWAMFNHGWTRVANPTATIQLGQIIAMEAHTMGLWTLNMSRIMETVDSPTRFGFLYATTPMHVEQGAERFLLEYNLTTGEVHYVLEAISRPRHLFALLGWPLSRHYQHEFVRESHIRMRHDAGNLES